MTQPKPVSVEFNMIGGRMEFQALLSPTRREILDNLFLHCSDLASELGVYLQNNDEKGTRVEYIRHPVTSPGIARDFIEINLNCPKQIAKARRRLRGAL